MPAEVLEDERHEQCRQHLGVRVSDQLRYQGVRGQITLRVHEP